MKSCSRFFSRYAVFAMMVLATATVAPFARAQAGGEDSQNAAPRKPLTKRLVADYTYWSKYQTPPYSAAQIPFEKITTVNHASIGIHYDGTLAVPHGFLEPKLLRRAHAAGVRVLVLLAPDPAKFSVVTKDPSLRATLVNNLYTFISENQYDGVDIDWEFPATEAQKDDFAEWALELRQALPSPTFLISVDSGPWGGSDTPFHRLASQIDYFNIMMYDCAGPWTGHAQLNASILWDHNDLAPSECQPGGSDDGAINIYLNELKLPASQLNIGTPFYGYWYQTVKGLFKHCPGAAENGDTCPDGTVFAENYGTFIKQRVGKDGWIRDYDWNAGGVPYLLKADGSRGFITYDDPYSTYNRIWYSVWVRGLGGTFMWAVDEDYDGHSQDLLDAMNQAIVDGEN